MKKNAGADRYRIIPYPSEYVLTDEKGRRLLAFPTEKEADEYLEELRKADEKTESEG